MDLVVLLKLMILWNLCSWRANEKVIGSKVFTYFVCATYFDVTGILPFSNAGGLEWIWKSFLS